MAGVSAAISSRESRKGQVVEPTPLDRLLGRFPADAAGYPEKQRAHPAGFPIMLQRQPDYRRGAVPSGCWTGLGPGQSWRGCRCPKATLLRDHDPGAADLTLQDALGDVPSVLRREDTIAMSLAVPELFRRYRRLSLRDVFLSFAGYRSPGDPVHRAISALSSGDLLQVRVGPHRWELLDHNGTVVGQLAGSFQAPAGMRPAFATVLAIVAWYRESSEPQYQPAFAALPGRWSCRSWCSSQRGEFTYRERRSNLAVARPTCRTSYGNRE